MHTETSLLGRAFSDWSALTDEYIAGMQALRRREPGASERMMEIARLMSEYQKLVVRGSMVATALPEPQEKASASRAPNWLQSVAATSFSGNDSLTVVH